MLAHLFEGLGQSIDGLHIQVVGGLIQQQKCVGAPGQMLVKTTRAFWPPLSLQMGCRWWCPDSPNLPSCCRICSGFRPACTQQCTSSALDPPHDSCAFRICLK